MSSAGKKMHDKMQEVAGKVKETAGKATGNEHLRAKGTAEKAQAQVKQAQARQTAHRSKGAITGKTKDKKGS
ncbi:CsbD family protein [Streptomyces mauvecolor]